MFKLLYFIIKQKVSIFFLVQFKSKRQRQTQHQRLWTFSVFFTKRNVITYIFANQVCFNFNYYLISWISLQSADIQLNNQITKLIPLIQHQHQHSDLQFYSLSKINSEMNHLFLLFIFLALHIVKSATLEGTWIVSSLSNSPTVNAQVKLTITDAIYRNTSIQQTFVFSGCQQFMYLGEILDNNLFVGYDTFYELPTINSNNVTVNCTATQKTFNGLIQSNFQQAFYFQIFGNYMSFISADQKNLITFSRDLSGSPNKLNLRGKWAITRINNIKTSQSLEISDTQMNLCQGAVDATITYNGKDKIKITITRNNNCSQPELITALKNSVYYRFKDNVTYFYDVNVSSTLIISFLENITNQQYLTDKQTAINASVITQTTNQTSQPTSNVYQLANNQNDLIGQWSPTNIFGIPLTNTPISIVFAYTSITYQGGCNTFLFAYTVDTNKKQFSMGQNKSTSNNCTVNDDGLYTNAIPMFFGYNISISSATSSIIMNIFASNGSSIMQLTRPIPVTASASASGSTTATTSSSTSTNTSSSNQLTTNTQTTKPSLTPNTYIFLILARRDIPRIFCNITTSQISYKGCNKITHIYEAKADGTIIITGGVVGNATKCTTDNDAIIYNTFNSAKYYTIQALGSYILQDKDKNEIINLSLF